MAQVVKAYTPVLKLSLGGRFFTTTEVELGTEYLTEGVVIEPEKLQLPDGLVDYAWATLVPTAAKNIKVFVPNLVIVNPGAVKQEQTTMKLQVYVSGKEKEFLIEEASKGEAFKEAKFIIAAVGR
jgi:hypothetical protein